MRRIGRRHVFSAALIMALVGLVVFRHDIQGQFYRGESIPVAITIDVCANPALTIDETLWETDDLVPPGLEGKTIDGILQTNGRGGALFRSTDDRVVLTYRTLPEGEFTNMI